MIEGITSLKSDQPATQLPDVHQAQNNLKADHAALDYLIRQRNFSAAVIEKYRLGVEEKYGKRWLVIPYYEHGSLVFVKYRTLPPAQKEFRSSHGRDVPLYNSDALVEGLKEIYFVEGEGDCLSMLSMGIENVVAIPGANMKKATWIKKLDEINPERIYLLYDSDKVGQKAAREMATKLGLEKCYNIALPPFTVDGKSGKDINEWFRASNTLKQFEELRDAAKPFDVTGISTLMSALEEVELDMQGLELNQKAALDTPWENLNIRLGGVEFGDLVGFSAEGKVGKTTMALNWLDYYVRSYGHNCLMFCLEMPPKRLARKWASFVTGTDDTPGRSQLTRETLHAPRDCQ